MQVVGRGDADGVNIGGRDDIAPVGSGTLEAEAPAGLLGARAVGVGADDEPWLDTLAVEAVGDLVVRPAVDTAHPAHADDADADVSHTISSLLAVRHGVISTSHRAIMRLALREVPPWR